MAETVRQTPDGYLTMAEARARLGVSKVTMARIVKAAGAQTYEDPRDARIKLLKVEDVEQMGRPTIALGPKFDSWQEDYRQTDEQLAGYLRMPLENLPAIRVERLKTIPGSGGWRSLGGEFPATNDPSAADLEVVAIRHKADPARLFDVFIGRKTAPEGKVAA